MKTIKQMLTELAAAGLKQTEIAKAVGSDQSTISRISRGVQIPNYDLGKQIEVLHTRHCQETAA